MEKKDKGIWLPELTANMENENIKSLLYLMAGGRCPEKRWIRDGMAGKRVWAVDKGVDACHVAGIVPECVVGDRDSARDDSWMWAVDAGARVFQYPIEKDRTDLQLALEIAGREEKVSHVVLSGGWGGRFDHTWSNVLSLVGARQWGIESAMMADGEEFLYLLHGPGMVTLNYRKKPAAISLLACTAQCQGVCIEGVHWPLHEANLQWSDPFAISNRCLVTETRVAVRVREGTLGVYFWWN